MHTKMTHTALADLTERYAGVAPSPRLEAAHPGRLYLQGRVYPGSWESYISNGFSGGGGRSISETTL